MAGHPLDQLSPEEIEQVARVCKLHHAVCLPDETLRFNVITLQEPSKHDLLAFEHDPSSANVPERKAFCILQSLPSAGVVEAVITVRQQAASAASVEQVVSWIKKPDVHALATPDDCFEAEAIVKADPGVQRLLLERYGISDLSLLAADPWSVHSTPLGKEQRVIQTFLYMRSSPDDNPYAHPLDMVPIVDMSVRRVVHIDVPHSSPPPINSVDNNYHRNLQATPWRTDIKPLNIVQPEGPSFSVDGNLVSWQKWRLRVGFNYREGLVLHQVCYQDGGVARPVVHRLSLVEMAVPYADPREPYTRKCAFDVGDYGLGYCTSSLSLGCDCVGQIHYFDAHLCNSAGQPTTIKNAVCMHEEDVGVLWKHVDYRTGHSESRRSRRLVLSFVATVVNYEYGIYISLYQDGTINYEIKLTGELSTNMLSPGEGQHPQYGTLVGPGVNAQHHQHMFCARLDMAVDDEQGGRGLEVAEVDVVASPHCPERNPYSNAFSVCETDLVSTSGAQRDICPAKGRLWKIKNPKVLNPVTGSPVAFKLVPGSAGPGLLAAPNSVVATKGHFASHNLWVTPYSEQQRFPAGDYVFGATECSGIKGWTQQDSSLVDADPVIWYTFGVTHVVRTEDFPVMPVETVGFSIKPFGFFTGNPSIDIPPMTNASSHSNCPAACAGQQH